MRFHNGATPVQWDIPKNTHLGSVEDHVVLFFVDNGTKIRFMGRERREDKTTNQKIAASYRGAAPQEGTLGKRGDLGGGHARNDLKY